MKRLVSRAVRIGAKVVFALSDPFFGKLPGPRILIYHQVGTDLGREMEVPTDTFRRQLDWLQSHGEIVDLETAIERMDEPDSDKLFVLTFDDGFEDVYHNAFPLMKKRGVPFTLYLTTRPIETGEPLNARYPDAKPLTWGQVTEMIGTGLVTVGAHTHTHPDLRRMSAEAIAEELDVSNTLIEERTGVRPCHFTYPWGWWSETVDPLVRERYETATVGDAAPCSESGVHRLPRVPVQRSDGSVFFARKASGGLRLEARARSRVHTRRQVLKRPQVSDPPVTMSDDRPQVVHVIDSLTSAGGAENRFVEEILEMNGLRHLVVRLYERSHLDDKLAQAGIPVVHLGLRSDRSAVQLPLGVARLRTLLRRHRPIAVHSSLFAANLVAQTAAALHSPRIPVLSTLTRQEGHQVDGFLFNRGATPFRRAVMAQIGRRIRSMRHVWHRAVSNAVKDSAVAHLGVDPDRIHVIPRGVRYADLMSSVPSREALGLPDGPLILNIGRLSAPKGQIHLIRALPLVHQTLPSTHVAIAGEPQDAAAELKDEISALGLAGFVHLLGHRHDVPALLAATDVVCLPSVSEGMPGVLLEALVAAKPVVALDIPAVREIVGDNPPAEIVPMGDDARLAKAILDVLLDRDHAAVLGSRGRDLVAGRFDTARIASEVEQLIRDLATTSKRRLPVAAPKGT